MIKVPKEPKTFKYPRLYLVEMGGAYDRIRIIWPDGRAQYSANGFYVNYEWDDSYIPCWWRDGMTAKQAVQTAKNYSRMEFIGEIK